MKEMNLATVLITKRREKGITQEELASHLGVSKQSVSKWENGNSYPDIVLLPQLASYFNISVDELIGYAPQMTAEEIRKLNMELLDEFATKPFEDVMNRCREIVKRYYSCFPLLFQMATIFVNYGVASEDEEQKVSILTEAKELFIRVKTGCDHVELKRIALSTEAFCEMELGNYDRVVILLENEIRYSIHPSIHSMLSYSYQSLGRTKEAKASLQDGIFSSVFNLLHDMPSYLSICTDDVNHYEEICRRTIALVELFNAKEFSPLTIIHFYINAAIGYLEIGNTEKALTMLESYTEIATGDISSLLIKGDNFFTLIEEIQNKQFNEFSFGTLEIPVDKQTIKQRLVDIVLDYPAFSVLYDNQQFQNLVKKLKQRNHRRVL